jgi:hypothetical protein
LLYYNKETNDGSSLMVVKTWKPTPKWLVIVKENKVVGLCVSETPAGWLSEQQQMQGSNAEAREGPNTTLDRTQKSFR